MIDHVILVHTHTYKNMCIIYVCVGVCERERERGGGCFPGGSDGKESTCRAGDVDFIPGLGRSPEKGLATNSSILAWRILWTMEPGIVHGVTQSQTQVSD